MVLAVDESRADELLSQLDQNPNVPEIVELFELVKKNGWQDVELLSRCITFLYQVARRNVVGERLDREILEKFTEDYNRLSYVIDEEFDVEEVVRLTSALPYSHNSIEHILLNTACTEDARLLAIRIFRDHLFDGEHPDSSVLPGPNSMDGPYKEEWKRHMNNLSIFSVRPPQGTVLALIELMSELDHSSQVRQEARNFLDAWQNTTSNKPQVDTSFDSIWYGLIESYRLHAQYFVVNIMTLLSENNRSAVPSSVRFDQLFPSLSSVLPPCRIVQARVNVPTKVPAYLDPHLLPQFRYQYN